MLHRDWTAGRTGHVAEHNAISARLLNVVDFGAKGDGFTDSTQAFLGALSVTGRYSVFVPVGRYVISQTLTTSGDLVHVYGDGRRQSVITRIGSGNLFASSGKIDFTDVALFADVGSCLVLSSNDVLIRSCWLHNHSGPMVSSTTGNLTITGCVFEMGLEALSLGGAYINISDCIFYDVAKYAIKAANAKGINIQNLLVETRTVSPEANVLVQISNCNNVNLCNLNFQRVFDATGEFPIGMELTGCDRVNLTNIQIVNVADEIGLSINGCNMIMGHGIAIARESGQLAIGTRITDSSRYRLTIGAEGCAQPVVIQNSPNGQVIEV